MTARSNSIISLLLHMYEYATFVGTSLKAGIKKPFYFKEIITQLYRLGYKSLAIVSLTSIFAGMVMTLQIGSELGRFGAKLYIGSIVSIALVRELGPVLTALVVAGRVGSGIAAELGSMQVTDQVDALRVMAVDPYKILVNTRIIALVIMLPILVAYADILGILGGMVIANTNFNIDWMIYWTTTIDALLLNDCISGLFKPVVFALIIGTLACYVGINTTGGTKGVGNSTTFAVVLSSIFIFLTDFLLTKLFFILSGV